MPPGQLLEDEDADREDQGALVHLLAARLLGRGVEQVPLDLVLAEQRQEAQRPRGQVVANLPGIELIEDPERVLDDRHRIGRIVFPLGRAGEAPEPLGERFRGLALRLIHRRAAYHSGSARLPIGVAVSRTLPDPQLRTAAAPPKPRACAWYDFSSAGRVGPL